jgi:hypothetical protein
MCGRRPGLVICIALNITKEHLSMSEQQEILSFLKFWDIPAFKEVISSVEFWKITAPAVFGIIAWLANERSKRIAWLANENSKREWERWQIKKVACLRALNIANAIISNYSYTDENKKELEIIPQYESVEAIRACFNDLACTCDGPEVINELKKIMFKQVTPAAIVDLRNAVRKELDMGSTPIDTDVENSFIGKVNCEKPA